MNNQVKGLAHIGVYTTDMKESIRFYTEVLGFELIHQKDLVKPDGTTRLGFVNAGGLVMEFVQPADVTGLKDKKAGIVDHIAIEVKEIDAVILRLKDNGVTFETQEKSELADLFNGVSNIFFSGPNGERLELFQYN
ncbi:MAG: VOC family protein [Firmicutes bacterium]|nr:VOC family protein [Bacillota bacterium]